MKQSDKYIAWQRTIAHMHGRRKAEEFLGFLAESGKVLSAEISFYESLPRLVEISVPFFGDWFSIDLFFGDGRVRNVAEKASRKLDESDVRKWRSAFRPFTQPDATGHPQVIVAKEAAFHSPDPEHPQGWEEELLTGLGVSSSMIVPLELPRGCIGVMTIACMASQNAEENRQYGPSELALGQELGRRVSLAVERSLLHQELHEVRERTATTHSIRE